MEHEWRDLVAVKLTWDDIEKVAYLSRLELTEEEKSEFTGHINRLLEHFENLQQLDTENVEPTSHVIPVYSVFRGDEVRPSLLPDDVVSNGPEVAENCFVVPRVVES